jgi:hypothetical protein
MTPDPSDVSTSAPFSIGTGTYGYDRPRRSLSTALNRYIGTRIRGGDRGQAWREVEQSVDRDAALAQYAAEQSAARWLS